MFEDVIATGTEAAERAVLGAGLVDQSAIRWASEQITADDFSQGTLGEVWKVLYTRWKAGEPTDAISMDGALRGVVHGYRPGNVFDLIDAAPVAGMSSHWAGQIKEGAKRRALLAMAERARQNATGGDLSEAITTAKTDLENIGKATTSKLDARPLARILEETDEYDWVIPGILEKRDRVIFTGGEGAGKSTLVRQMAILSAAGLNPLTFEEMQPARVLIVDAENTEKQWRRATRDIVVKASEHLGAPVGELIPLACVPRLDVTKERDLSAIHDLIDRHEPDIVFIGPLYKLVPRAIQSDDDAAPLINALDSIRGRDVALVMEAHAGHTQSSPGNRDLRPRGSAALLGWPEFGIGLRVDADYAQFRADPHNFRNRKVDLTRWRGDRDERNWPNSIYPGDYWRWVPEDYARTSSYPAPRPMEAA